MDGEGPKGPWKSGCTLSFIISRIVSTPGAQDPPAAHALAPLPAGLARLQALGDAAAPALPQNWSARVLEQVRDTADPGLALIQITRLVEGEGGGRRLEFLLEAPRALQAVATACGASPFLGDSLVRHPEWLEWLCAGPVLARQPGRGELRRELAAHLRGVREEAAALDALRVFKRKHTLRIAVRDLLRLASVDQTVRAVSALAGVLLERAFTLCEAGLRRELGLAPAPPPGLGLAVLGLGKLGGEELNFSSDVDLIYVAAAEEGRLALPDGAVLPKEEYFRRLCRRFTAAVSHPSDEGSLYRVDLRLRPQGRSGPLVRDLASFAAYYARHGESWERFALLKARPVAGGRRLGERCLEAVRPFVYGRPFDAAPLAELHRLKGRIDAHMTQRNERGSNVKLGFGGIREIELAVQAFQLRFGRGRPALHQRSTLGALRALLRHGLLGRADHEALAQAYTFLRDVENKLQMVLDAQTHTLPGEGDVPERRRLALRLGYRDRGDATAQAAFEADHARHTRAVHQLFRSLLYGEGGAAPTILTRRPRAGRRHRPGGGRA